MKFFAFILLFVFSSCYRTQDIQIARIEKLDPIIYNIDHVKMNSLEFIKCIKEFKCLKLETNQSGLVSDIKKVGILDDRIIVFDKSNSGLLLAFDIKSGALINLFGSRGNGPGEYSHILDVDWDIQTRQVFVQDEKRNILKFSLEGKYIESVLYSEYPDNVAYLGNDSWAFVSKQDHVLSYEKSHALCDELWRLTILDKSGKLSRCYFPYEKHQPFALRNGPFFRSGGELNYINAVSDTVYLINQNQVIPKYVLDFGNHRLIQDEIPPVNPYEESSFRNYIQNTSKSGYVSWISSYYETESHIAVKYSFEGMSYLGIIRKSDGISITGVNIDTKVGLKILPTLVGTYDNYFIFQLPAFVAKMQFDEFNKQVSRQTLTNSPIISEFIDVASNISNEENPILFFIKFK